MTSTKCIPIPIVLSGLNDCFDCVYMNALYKIMLPIKAVTYVKNSYCLTTNKILTKVKNVPTQYNIQDT